jgi:hypothetical protein
MLAEMTTPPLAVHYSTPIDGVPFTCVSPLTSPASPVCLSLCHLGLTCRLPAGIVLPRITPLTCAASRLWIPYSARNVDCT